MHRREQRFWEEAFFDSFQAEMSKTAQLQKYGAQPETPTRAAAGDGAKCRWHSDAEQAEALNRQRNVLFAQLGTELLHMVVWEVDRVLVHPQAPSRTT
jgi:hypothetical protein